ncbi:hypothetical protein [Trichocoleus sp. FACHB-262]|uniref:hypothetical protein n=1 Tax=Trichocoleus sp. FACHB-262 TaxID=2692869 RepID=UPI0016869BAD|nr:hypothetical protein [Trichocoleus sp. FACHB-262]MBD2122885.1 hypothetical protein [Trichocoleus sp. FACHB-262]
MFWHFTGEMMIHPQDGSQPYFEEISETFDLPDENVRVIRDFVYSQRDFILKHKYEPSEGEAPWGTSQLYSQMIAELNRLQPTEQYWFGTKDKQIKAALVAYRNELIDNLDCYMPTEPRRELAAVA